MAADYSFEGQPEALERAVFCECLQCVLAAGGREPAGGRGMRRDTDLIESYQEYEGCRQYAPERDPFSTCLLHNAFVLPKIKKYLFFY